MPAAPPPPPLLVPLLLSEEEGLRVLLRLPEPLTEAVLRGALREEHGLALPLELGEGEPEELPVSETRLLLLALALPAEAEAEAGGLSEEDTLADLDTEALPVTALTEPLGLGLTLGAPELLALALTEGD